MLHGIYEAEPHSGIQVFARSRWSTWVLAAVAARAHKLAAGMRKGLKQKEGCLPWLSCTTLSELRGGLWSSVRREANAMREGPSSDFGLPTLPTKFAVCVKRRNSVCAGFSSLVRGPMRPPGRGLHSKASWLPEPRGQRLPAS